MLRSLRALACSFAVLAAPAPAFAADAAPRWTIDLRHPSDPGPEATAVFLRGLHSRGASLVARVSYGLVSIRDSGSIRWHYAITPACGAGVYDVCFPWIEHFEATNDAGAWSVEEFGPPQNYSLDRLRRLDSSGTVVGEYSLAQLPGLADSRHVFTSGRDSATLFWAETYRPDHRIRWFRVDRHGEATQGEIVLPRPGWVLPFAAHTAQDGGTWVAFVPDSSPFYCAPLQDCGNYDYGVARLDAAGRLRWQRQFELRDPYDLAFGPDGAVWAVGPGFGHRIRSIDGDGRLSAGFELPLLDPSYSEQATLAAPRAGEIVVHAQAGVRRVDSSGRALAQHGLEPGHYHALQHASRAPAGTLVTSAAHPDGVSGRVAVLDGELQRVVSAPLHAPCQDVAGCRPVSWSGRFTADGAAFVATSATEGPQSIARSRISRFDMPGTAAAWRLHRDGFD